MRKRIVISVLATVPLGVLVFVLSQRTEGSVQDHKKEYRVAVRYRDRQWMERHERALVKLGYFEKQVFTVSNESPAVVVQKVFDGWAGELANGHWQTVSSREPTETASLSTNVYIFPVAKPGVQFTNKWLSGNGLLMKYAGFAKKCVSVSQVGKDVFAFVERTAEGEIENVAATLRIGGRDKIVVVAPREDMPKWGELIRKVDVPEDGK